MAVIMNKIKVLLAEDHVILRSGIRLILEKENYIEVVGEVSNGNEVMQQLEEMQPHIILMDISMPILNGIFTTRKVKNQFPHIKILMLSRHSAYEYVHQSFMAGANGYLVKSTAPSELLTAIRALAAGESYISSTISKVLVNEYIKMTNQSNQPSLDGGLSERECEVLQLLVEGHSTNEIAEMLFISPNTVASHRKNIMQKLDIHSVSQLTQYAIRTGIIELDIPDSH